MLGLTPFIYFSIETNNLRQGIGILLTFKEPRLNSVCPDRVQVSPEYP